MRKIVAVSVLAAMTTLGTAAAVAAVAAGTGVRPGNGPRSAYRQAPTPPEGWPEGGVERQEVSQEQYGVLIGQCRYPKTGQARERCRTQVRAKYVVGAFNPALDCRTYSGISVCGTLELSAAQRRAWRSRRAAG